MSPTTMPQRLKNALDITRDPFSDRGSPLLVYQHPSRDQLQVRFAHRFADLEPRVGPYLKRQPCLEGLRLVDGEGKALEFELTSYPHLLVFHTRVGPFQLVIQGGDTLVWGLPPHCRCGLRFQTNPPLAAPSAHQLAPDDTLHLTYTASCPAWEEEITARGQGQLVSLAAQAGRDDAIHLMIGRGDHAPPSPTSFSRALEGASKRWQGWFARIPDYTGPYEEQYLYAWWVMANNLIDPAGDIPYPGVMPSKAKYVGIWNWDACFHALALRHIDPDLARDQLRIILAHQRPDGMLPDAVHQDGVVNWLDHPIPGPVTKPPVMAWTALQLHRSHPDPSFLQEIYPRLVAWHDWWFARTDEHGLAQYHHPYSSGLDDNPVWDHGFPVTAPDLNTYLVIQRDALADICRLLGKIKERDRWRKKAGQLARRLEAHLYDAQQGGFVALHQGQPIPEWTPFNLYPLITGRVAAALKKELLKQLRDPKVFWSRYPLPTVALDHPSFDPDTMWRGPVWVNINYLFIQGLRRSGEKELARQLRRRTLQLVNQNQGIFEYYHPLDGSPPSQAAPMFSWTAALFLDLLLEEDQDGTT